MPNPWFRMYSEFADDPKVQIMPEHMQRRLVMLFCERCKEETLHETERAFHWRISETTLAETKTLFREKGFIDDHWNLLNWNTRQFLSDSSTERVRQYRERQKQNETFQEQDNDVTVTPPDTDSEAEEKRQKPYPSTPEDGVSDEIRKLEAEQAKEEARAFAKIEKARIKAAAAEEVAKILAARKIAAKKAKAPTKSDFATSRHAEFKLAVFEYWKSKNTDIDCPWSQPEGMQLELWLRSSPNVTINQFKQMLRNRYKSDVNHSDRPSNWLKNITSYANGPLNQYRQKLNGEGQTNGKTDRSIDIASKLVHEFEDTHGAHGGQLLPGGGGHGAVSAALHGKTLEGTTGIPVSSTE